jgi:hypothetical protein
VVTPPAFVLENFWATTKREFSMFDNRFLFYSNALGTQDCTDLYPEGIYTARFLDFINGVVDAPSTPPTSKGPRHGNLRFSRSIR